MLVPTEAPGGCQLGSLVRCEAEPGEPSFKCGPFAPQTDLPPASKACWAVRPIEGKERTDRLPFTQSFWNTQPLGQVPPHEDPVLSFCPGSSPYSPWPTKPNCPGGPPVMHWGSQLIPVTEPPLVPSTCHTLQRRLAASSQPTIAATRWIKAVTFCTCCVCHIMSLSTEFSPQLYLAAPHCIPGQ